MSNWIRSLTINVTINQLRQFNFLQPAIFPNRKTMSAILKRNTSKLMHSQEIASYLSKSPSPLFILIAHCQEKFLASDCEVN